MEINTHNAEILLSAVSKAQYPEDDLPEIALAGRSNVGKSSFINTLLGRKNLARTSGKPGKTQQLNFYNIDDKIRFVDVPGYGYAKVSKSLRKDFEKLITNYILNRKNLVNLFVLIDIRHTPQKIDIEFIEWCGENGIPFSIVFTKLDKMKPNAAKENVEKYKVELLKSWDSLPEIYVTSAEKKEGTEEILNFISTTNDFLIKNKVDFNG